MKLSNFILSDSKKNALEELYLGGRIGSSSLQFNAFVATIRKKKLDEKFCEHLKFPFFHGIIEKSIHFRGISSDLL